MNMPLTPNPSPADPPGFLLLSDALATIVSSLGHRHQRALRYHASRRPTGELLIDYKVNVYWSDRMGRSWCISTTGTCNTLLFVNQIWTKFQCMKLGKNKNLHFNVCLCARVCISMWCCTISCACVWVLFNFFFVSNSIWPSCMNAWVSAMISCYY
jgi:hypothetical protein